MSGERDEDKNLHNNEITYMKGDHDDDAYLSRTVAESDAVLRNKFVMYGSVQYNVRIIQFFETQVHATNFINYSSDNAI